MCGGILKSYDSYPMTYHLLRGSGQQISHRETSHVHTSITSHCMPFANIQMGPPLYSTRQSSDPADPPSDGIGNSESQTYIQDAEDDREGSTCGSDVSHDSMPSLGDPCPSPDIAPAWFPEGPLGHRERGLGHPVEGRPDVHRLRPRKVPARCHRG